MTQPFGGDIVTGEAVRLDLRIARVGSRAVAKAIDVAAQLTLLLVLSYFFSLAGAGDDAALEATSLVITILCVAGYPVVSEALWRGRTLGKAALGLRVVRDDGGPIVFRHALVRGLVGALVDFGITLGAGALISSLLSDRGKRIGDIAAGTVVIQERVPSARGPMAHMPPPLAAWAATADLSRVPDDLALAARQFISRQHDLDPQIRESMGSRLVADVAAVVAPPPPPGTPGWAYLAAVLAERRRRSEQQLASRQPPPVAPSPVTAPPSSGVVQAPPVAPTPAAAEPPPAGPFAPPA